MKRVAGVLAALLGSVFFVLIAAPIATATTQGDSIRIRVIGADDEDVAGIELTVTGPDGFEETVTTTGEQFTEVPVPGPGTYVVTIDEDTIPEEQGAASRESVSVDITPGLSKTALFRLGAEERETQNDLEQGLNLFVSGIIFGLIIAMAAIGLSLIYGTTGLTNFAHGELVTLGALVAYFFNVTMNLPLILAAALSFFVCGVLGGVQDGLFWRRLRKRGTGLIAMLVVSIGLSLFARNAFLFFFGGGTEQFADYSGQAGLNIGPVSVTPKELIGSAIAIVLLLATAYWLLRTRIGKATRAVADNPALASASGIDVERVINIVWILGAALAAYAGRAARNAAGRELPDGLPDPAAGLRGRDPRRPGHRVRCARREPGRRHRDPGVHAVDPHRAQERGGARGAHHRPAHPTAGHPRSARARGLRGDLNGLGTDLQQRDHCRRSASTPSSMHLPRSASMCTSDTRVCSTSVRPASSPWPHTGWPSAWPSSG